MVCCLLVPCEPSLARYKVACNKDELSGLRKKGWSAVIDAETPSGLTQGEIASCLEQSLHDVCNNPGPNFNKSRFDTRDCRNPHLSLNVSFSPMTHCQVRKITTVISLLHQRKPH